MVDGIAQIREVNPQYSGLSDNELMHALHQNYKPEMNFNEFSKGMGYDPTLVGAGARLGKQIVNTITEAIPETVLFATDTIKNYRLDSAVKLYDVTSKIQDNAINRAGDWAKDFKQPMELNETEKKSISSQIGSMVGNVAKFGGAMILGNVPAMFPIAYGQAKRSINEMYPEWSESEKESYASVSGAFNTALGAINLNVMFAPYLKTGASGLASSLTKPNILNIFKTEIKKGLLPSAESLVIGGLQQTGQNAIDKAYGMDKDLWENTVQSSFLNLAVSTMFRIPPSIAKSHVAIKQYKQWKDTYNLSDSEISTLQDTIASVTDEAFKANPEGLQEAIQTISNSDLFLRMPEETQRLIDRINENPVARKAEKDLAIKNIMELPVDKHKEILDDIINEQVKAPRSVKDIVDYAKTKNVELSVNEENSQIELSLIRVSENDRGIGVGSDVISKLNDYADSNNQIITATAGTEFGGKSLKDIVNFYKKNGFVENKGENANDMIEASMYRLPRSESIPDTQSRLSRRTSQKLYEKYGITIPEDELVKYKSLVNKDQLDLAMKYYDTNPESAKMIALGLENPPEGILPTSFYVVAEKMAIKNKDIDMLQSLATQSSISKEASQMGQFIQMLSNINSESPLRSIQSVSSARVKNYDTLNKVSAERTIKIEGEKLSKKIIKSFEELDENIETFIKELEC